MAAARKPHTPAKPGRGTWGIQWENADWDYVGAVARNAGLTRSEFIRRATLSAAKALELGLTSYYAGGASPTPHNTRANLFSSEGDQKAATGGGRGAPDRSRSDGKAKVGSTNVVKAKAPTGRGASRS